MRFSLKEIVAVIVSMCASVCVLSPVQLLQLTDCSPPGSSVHGILQARTLERGATSSSRGLPTQGLNPSSCVSCTGRWSFTTAPSGNPAVVIPLPLHHLGTPAMVIPLLYKCFLCNLKTEFDFRFYSLLSHWEGDKISVLPPFHRWGKRVTRVISASCLPGHGACS